MAEYDYSTLHDMTDEQIIVDVTLHYPCDEEHTPADRILLDSMRRFCPPGLKCCFASWRNGLKTFVFFPDHLSSPTQEHVIAAFYMQLAYLVHDENKNGGSE